MKKSTVLTALGVLGITCFIGNNAYQYYTRDKERKDPQRIQQVFEMLAPTVTPEKPKPLLRAIPTNKNLPTGSFTIDFMRTDFLKERQVHPNVPKAVVCTKAVQRIQFDILGTTRRGKLNFVYQFQRRWRGEPGGDAMSGFARPFNVIFHDSQTSYKNGIGFSIHGFNPLNGEVFIGEYDRQLPTVYFQPDQHKTVICCAAAPNEARMACDPKMYASTLRWTSPVYTGKVAKQSGLTRQEIPLKQLMIPDNQRYQGR